MFLFDYDSVTYENNRNWEKAYSERCNRATEKSFTFGELSCFPTSPLWLCPLSVLSLLCKQQPVSSSSITCPPSSLGGYLQHLYVTLLCWKTHMHHRNYFTYKCHEHTSCCWLLHSWQEGKKVDFDVVCTPSLLQITNTKPALFIFLSELYIVNE